MGAVAKGLTLPRICYTAKSPDSIIAVAIRHCNNTVCANRDRIDKVELEKVVMESIQACIFLFVEEGMLRKKDSGNVQDSVKARIGKIDRELAGLAGKMVDLYQDTVEQVLDNTDYLLMRTEFFKRKADLEREKNTLLQEQKKKDSGTSIPAKLKTYRGARKLNRKMVECFVEGIWIYNNKRIEVKLLCRDDILKRLEG